MNPTALFTMSYTGLDIIVRSVEKDNHSSIPMGFYQLAKSFNIDRGFTLIDLLIVYFADKSGMIGRAHRTRELYGRVTEVHLAFESKPVFTDNHLDRIVTTPT